MFDLNILEKQLEDATKNKYFERPTFKKKKVQIEIRKLSRIKIKELLGYG